MITIESPTTVMKIKFFVCPACGKAFGARVPKTYDNNYRCIIACIYCDYTALKKSFKKVVY